MLRVESLTVKEGGFQLGPISLEVHRGEFFIIIGPTGSGKSMLLESIVGLRTIRSGRVFISGKDITSLPPEKRGIGIVYQDHALFPHLSVWKNVTYGLRFNRKCSGCKRPDNEYIEKIIKLLEIESLLSRSPLTLSGGEKQKVALARALVVKPLLLLLDEPLSNLDQAFRAKMGSELKKMNRETNTTFVMVTHDIREALKLADRIGIMQGGKIVHIGEPSGKAEDWVNW